MSRFLTKGLKQTAVYWATPLPDGWGGQTYSDPVEISVRWENKSEMFIDSKGNEVRSRSIVYVSQDIDISGYLFLGKLIDLDSSQDPDTQTGAYQVKSFTKVPNLKGTEYARKVWL